MDEVEGSWASSLTGARAVDGSGAESPSFGDGKFRYCRQFPDELEDVTSLSPSHCAPPPKEPYMQQRVWPRRRLAKDKKWPRLDPHIFKKKEERARAPVEMKAFESKA